MTDSSLGAESRPHGPEYRKCLILQDGVVLTDFTGEAPDCLPSLAQRAGWMVQSSEKGQRPGHL